MASAKERLVQSFRRLDPNGSGVIPRATFEDVMRCVCQGSPAWLESLDFALGRVGGGDVDYQEFFDWVYGGSGEPAAAEQEGLAPEEFEMVIDTTLQDLGVQLDPEDGVTLSIWGPLGGLVQQWNEIHPEFVVKPGDRIVMVNGIRDDVDQMSGELDQNKELKLLVKRQAESDEVEQAGGKVVGGSSGPRRRHQFDNGAVYDGEWLVQVRHGQGTQTWTDGAEYSGDWVNDKAQGHGVFKHVDGGVYIGQWMNDKAEGEGRYEYADGSQYVGQWREDKQHGKGEETWSDGAKYEGEYRGGRKNGKGKFSWQDGSTYEGEFVDNDIHGQGHYQWSCGRQFNGQWCTNRMHGRGTFTWVDGRSYQGEYLNDQKHGFGAFKWPDGCRYEGLWRDGKQHGEGKYYSADGACRMGEWVNGKRSRWSDGEQPPVRGPPLSLQAAVAGSSADELGNKLEDGVHSEVGAERQLEAVDLARLEYIDPASLVRILRTKQVRLLSAEFVLDWIDGDRGPLPCRQDLPEVAFVDVEALSEQELASLTIIAISYCWLSEEHPDPHCYHLKTLGSLLRCFCSSSYSSAPDDIRITTTAIDESSTTKLGLWRNGAHFGAGDDGRCVGIFMDWTGLYQDKPRGRRTPEQSVVFESALQNINMWYAHISTIVWIFTSVPATVQRKSYHGSGWTTFEASVACILTKGTDILEITDQVRAALLSSTRGCVEYIQLSYDAMLRKNRVPATPEEFDRVIEDKVFTNGADKERVVKPKYSKTFHDLIPSSPAIELRGAGITSENSYQILNLANMHILRLKTLDLSHNSSIDLPIERFAKLPSLTRLQLSVTAVTGDVGSLKALVNLENLNLSYTQVSGDVGALHALVHLTQLRLGHTQVCGDVGALCVLGNLTRLGLSHTRVVGDVGELHPLVKLTFLGLQQTQVTGDVGKLQALVNLKVLKLDGSQVTGCRR